MEEKKVVVFMLSGKGGGYSWRERKGEFNERK